MLTRRHVTNLSKMADNHHQSCPYCSSTNESFYAPSQKLLKRHIKFVHSQEPGFQIECKEPLCLRKFSNWRTYQNHLLVHKGDDLVNSFHSEEPMNVDNNNTSHVEPILSLQDDLDDDDDISSPCFMDYCAKWILKTSECRRLTRYKSCYNWNC